MGMATQTWLRTHVTTSSNRLNRHRIIYIPPALHRHPLSEVHRQMRRPCVPPMQCLATESTHPVLLSPLRRNLPFRNNVMPQLCYAVKVDNMLRESILAQETALPWITDNTLRNLRVVVGIVVREILLAEGASLLYIRASEETCPFEPREMLALFVPFPGAFRQGHAAEGALECVSTGPFRPLRGWLVWWGACRLVFVRG
jgi:hypothetical protein